MIMIIILRHHYDDQVWCSLTLSSLPSLLAFCSAQQEHLITKVSLVIVLVIVLDMGLIFHMVLVTVDGLPFTF